MWKRAVTGLAVSLALLLFFSLSSPARAKPVSSEAAIACFHPKTQRFTAEAHPNRCRLRGYRETRVVGVPIEGMSWSHWGANPTRAAFGNDLRGGAAVRVIAYRPIACDEGLRWYSRVMVVYPGRGEFFELRLPICGRSLIG